jgi:hypothetical protein
VRATIETGELIQDTAPRPFWANGRLQDDIAEDRDEVRASEEQGKDELRRSRSFPHHVLYSCALDARKKIIES